MRFTVRVREGESLQLSAILVSPLAALELAEGLLEYGASAVQISTEDGTLYDVPKLERLIDAEVFCLEPPQDRLLELEVVGG